MGADESSIQGIVEEATFDFTMGDADGAVRKLDEALAASPGSFEGWHALCEIHYSEKRYDQALSAAEKAHALRPGDVFVNTSLSRIWLELGSKERAEHFGAQARMADWRSQLANPQSSGTDKGGF